MTGVVLAILVTGAAGGLVAIVVDVAHGGLTAHEERGDR